jgi:hypothetical protein
MQKSDYYRILGYNENKTRWTRDRPGGHEFLTYFGHRDSNKNGGKCAKKMRKKKKRLNGKQIVRAKIMEYNNAPVVCSFCHSFCEDNETCYQSMVAEAVEDDRLYEQFDRAAEEAQAREEEEYYYDVMCDEDTEWDPYWDDRINQDLDWR